MLKRLTYYLNEMFPLPSFIGTLLTAFAFQMTYIRLFGIPAQFHYQMLLSGIVITSVTLLIRVMDEFKDYEDDKINFPHRPLPSGKVYPEDLKKLGAVCIFLVLSLSTTSVELFLFSLFTLAYTYLMLKWFYAESQMRKSLPLAFVSHHPIVLINMVYLIFGMILTFEGVNWSKSWMVLPIALIFTNWEIARKIRMPVNETAYTTYSKIWGPRVAVGISLSLQIIYTATLLMIFSELQSPMFFRVVFGILMLVMFIPSIRFLIHLKLKAPLKTNAESQILLIIGFMLAACFL